MQKAQSVKTKNDALNVIQSAGMDNAFLDKALQSLDTPKAQKLMFIANMLGVNVNDIKQGINDLKSSTGTNYSKVQDKSKVDELASLKRGLKRLK